MALNNVRLHYRIDLLVKYNFSEPPQTLEELRIQTAVILAGEHAAGHYALHGVLFATASLPIAAMPVEEQQEIIELMARLIDAGEC